MSRIILAALVLIASVIAGCSGPAVSPSAEPSSQPSAEPESEAPQPTLPADEVEEKFSQRIEGQYCVGKSKADWCPYVKRSQVTENYVFLVDGPTAAVVTKLADKKKDRRLATALCDDLVKSESSDVIVVFGFTHFTVFGRHAIPLATCDVPR